MPIRNVETHQPHKAKDANMQHPHLLIHACSLPKDPKTLAYTYTHATTLAWEQKKGVWTKWYFIQYPTHAEWFVLFTIKKVHFGITGCKPPLKTKRAVSTRSRNGKLRVAENKRKNESEKKEIRLMGQPFKCCLLMYSWRFFCLWGWT